MTSASSRESRIGLNRGVLMRTAATALIAASPFVYSGASAAVGGVQITAPFLAAGKDKGEPLLFSLVTADTGGFQLTAPIFLNENVANGSLLPSNFNLSAPPLLGAGTAGPSLAGPPVQNLLAVPMDAEAGQAAITSTSFAINSAPGTTTVDNSDDLTVGDAETAIDIDADPNHVVINNSGDLTGGGGISVITGKLVDDESQVVNNSAYEWTTYYNAPLFDEAGNAVTGPCYPGSTYICPVTVTKTARDNSIITRDLNANQSDAQITINNSGDIDFSGVYGIKALNPTGASIDITSSGDITATSDTPRRVGIYANTTAPYYSSIYDGPNTVVPGEYTYNSEGELTGVITPGQQEATTTRTRMTGDVGAIRIVNNGAIDMGEVVLEEFPFGAASEGITAVGYGGIEIVNSGSVKVGDISVGIQAISSGNVMIENAGSIVVGNQSIGISSTIGGTPPFQIGDDFRIGGDVTILNTGDISGGMTVEEVAESPNAEHWGTQTPAYAVGIQSNMLGSNNDYYGQNLHFNAALGRYNEAIEYYNATNSPDAEDLPLIPLAPIPEGLENFTTTLVNEGNISLKDGGRGIVGVQKFGTVYAINGGTITVGNGTSHFDYNSEFHSAGVYLTNFWVNGYSDLVAQNNEDGIIVTGDDSTGISVKSWFGNATAINYGSITVGNGVVGTDNIFDPTYTYSNPYDRLFKSIGMEVGTGGFGVGVSAIAVNSGDITTGDLSVGMLIGGNGFNIYDPTRITGIGINDGAITGGFNSSGIIAGGNNLYILNSGSIAIGDKDVSGYNPHDFTEWAFDETGYGIVAKSDRVGQVGNDGTITTGDNTVGIFNGMRQPGRGYASLTRQGENGIISTGDNSVGIRGEADLYVVLDNAGRISVGNDSVGVELTPGVIGHDYYNNAVVRTGAALAINSGVIETGDNSVGIRLNGARYGVEHSWQRYQFPEGMVDFSVTGDILGSALLQNSGTIRVGANSTAVEISGYGYYGVNLYNIGTIDAGAGTAIKINADNALGSGILNGGTIIGDILLGAGDDMFLHGQNIDPATGQVLSTGNIIMNGNTIDFGGGENTFRIQRGVISVAGGDNNLITGDNLTVEMEYGEIDARDDFLVGPSTLAASTLATTTNFSTLIIDGDVSGNFRFATDVGEGGVSDELIITGNLADGSSIGVVLNPVEQLKGEVEIRPINIGGTNGADVIEVAGISGLYADSLVASEARFNAASGDIIISATFGLGHMGTAANAAAISARNWLGGTLSSYGNRNIHAYTGRKGEGLAIWGYAFQDEGRIHPDSDLQDLGFSQISTGLQAGVQWSQDIWGGRVSISPMVTYGTVEANLHANTSSSRGHPWAVGLNANYAQEGGLYVDATYQRMQMDVDLKTPQTATQATGEAKVNGQGFNLEAGYSHKLSSGLTLEPQLQLTHVKVDMDGFASSDDAYNFSDIDGKSTTLRAGVSVYKVFQTANGSITPLASLSYINALGGKTQLVSNGVDFDSDTSGSGYKAEIGLLGRYQSWDFAGKLGVSNTSATGSILQPSLTVRYGFGGNAKASAQAAAVPQLPGVTEATVRYGEAGNAAVAPLATAASDEDGAQVVSAADAQTGAEPAEEQEKNREQTDQTSPELHGQERAEPANPMDRAAEPPADAEADPASDIVVTGSLIRRSTATEATPITVVTSEDMAERGLMTLGEVMQSFTQNEGYVEGKASNLLGRFTFGAEEINFRGLGAGRTLVLVNGRRIADYPLPFGGEQNGVDLGTIPYSAIAKVEYLSAGASATYGSDAVGGVVNIITKRDMEQTLVEASGGIYQQGFGESGRASVITGNSFARGSFTVGVEGYYSGEILAGDAKYFRKNAPFNAGMIDIVENTAGGQSSVLPQSACAPLGFEFSGGQCSSNVSDTISLNPKTRQGSAFFDGRYDLTDRIELFGTAMASIGKSESRSNVLFWQGVVANEDNSGAMFITRGFSEDELGVSTVTVDNNMWTVVVGAKGGIDVGSGTWYWDVAASHASFDTKQTSINLKEEGIKNWILNGASSVTDSPDQRYTYFVDADFYNDRLIDNIVRPVGSADVDSLIGENVMRAGSNAQSLTATLNGTFGDLGILYKPVKFAVRAEYGRQETKINPDDRSLNTTGEGWFNIGAIEAHGKRNRWALAAEADMSVLSNLDVVLAGRYDHYDDDSSITGRFTGQAKFLYRPTDWLKIRGGYGQTFRAPDMFNIYGRSDGFEVVPDFSAPGCFDGSTYVCGGFQVASTRQADPRLKEEHGDDLGLGVILNPLPRLQITADWYNIRLKDLVLTESSFDLVLKEWQCANGVLDGSSALCVDVNNRVIRNGFGALERVIVQPINSSELTRSGIDIQASYNFESEKLGAFNFNLGYSRVLKFKLTRFEGDDPIDLKYGEPGSATPGNNLNFGVNWNQPLTAGKAIAAGIFVQRTGRVYNFDQSQFLEPFYDVNLSAAYQLNAKTSFRLNINNLLNAEPQPNGSGFWPGYWAHLQTANALGRSAYVSVGYSFK